MSVRYAFLGLCGLTISCMTALIALGHDGAITDTLLGVSALMFGAQFWEVLRSRG